MKQLLITSFLILLAGIVVFYFMDYIMEIILGIFGLGMAGAASKKLKQKNLEAVADEHIDLSNNDLNQAVETQKEADQVHKGTQDIADGIENRYTTGKRKSFRAD